MHHRRLAIAVLGVLTLAGSACSKRELRYDDDLDLAGLRTSFACASKPSGDRAHACRILDDFSAAGAFQAWPSKGLETWFGRKVCTDSVDIPDRMDFGRVHLKPGLGKALFPDDIKTDPSRDVPVGAEFIAATASNFKADERRGYLEAIEAAKDGVTPKFESLAAFERSSLVRFWETTKTPPGTPKYYRLVRSKGASVLGGALSTGEASKNPSATYFMRGRDNRMLVIYPSLGMKPPVSCVAELWKMYSEP